MGTWGCCLAWKAHGAPPPTAVPFSLSVHMFYQRDVTTVAVYLPLRTALQMCAGVGGGGEENRENRCAVKGEGGYIQADQTKWPLMLSLLVQNQMTLQQELLTRVHTSVCVCVKASI